MQTRPISSDGILSLFKSDPQKKLDKEQNLKVQTIKHRLHSRGYMGIDDEQITYALLGDYADGDADKAFEMVILFQESVDGVIKPCNPEIQMKGAVNRDLVTCYLDATLFAMFARLGSFEPILYTLFDDEPTRRLATLIRLWVNLLRTGMLIHTDITKHIQDSIAACGWEDAALLEQQDTSEAFSFLTEKLKLPLLTLKMDIYHNGKEDVKDDHRIIYERLLEVAVPDEPAKLEECLESYFNNNVEVVRKLERSNTVSSVRSGRSSSLDKGSSQHVEVTVSEVSWSNPGTPTSTHPPRSPLSPSGRHRTDSFIRPRVITEIQEDEKGEKASESDAMSTRKLLRKGSVRKEVLMPAWQFFNLIPWYTKNTTPTNDRDVAAQFVNTPPVLGICLKRYAMSASGVATRKNTHIDIPTDIRLPHFVDDGPHVEGGPLMENFKLSLQSIICHQGNSVNSGHYISFVRDGTEIADGDSSSNRRNSTSSQPPHYSKQRWIKHDDLAKDRISPVDIEKVLQEGGEMPYLLFYEVLPIHDLIAPSIESDPPAYEHEAGIDVRVSESSPLAERKPEEDLQGYFDNTPKRDESAPAPSVRFSSEIDRPRHSGNLEARRGSTAPTELSLGSPATSIRAPEGRSNPVTPIEETTVQRLSRAASRFGSKSRPTSSSGDNRITENRISATFSRIGLRSKESFHKTDHNKDSSHSNPVAPSTAVSTAPSLAPTVAATTDGASEMRDSAIAMDDTSLKPAQETPKRGRSIRGRKRESKEQASKLEKVENGHHHHLHRAKGSKSVPDRECIIM